MRRLLKENNVFYFKMKLSCEFGKFAQKSPILKCFKENFSVSSTKALWTEARGYSDCGAKKGKLTAGP